MHPNQQQITLSEHLDAWLRLGYDGAEDEELETKGEE